MPVCHGLQEHRLLRWLGLLGSACWAAKRMLANQGVLNGLCGRAQATAPGGAVTYLQTADGEGPTRYNS